MWALPLLLPLTFASPPFQVSDSVAPKLIEIARSAVTATVTGRSPSPTPTVGDAAKPVFVTIERNGKILGCRGSLVARQASLGEEIRAAACSAASHDPRYRPMQLSDLKDFLVTVTLVERLESISDVSDLRPSEGLVLTASGKTGVVLPWEGKDPHVRLEWAYKKAGVSIGSAVTLQKLIAQRWRG